MDTQTLANISIIIVASSLGILFLIPSYCFATEK